uniref:Uncharacterized protein n=1 Tax=Rhizophora mucronata TaxID=61149 RepID=A0A2P2PXF3_RHIMU
MPIPTQFTFVPSLGSSITSKISKPDKKFLSNLISEIFLSKLNGQPHLHNSRLRSRQCFNSESFPQSDKAWILLSFVG